MASSQPRQRQVRLPRRWWLRPRAELCCANRLERVVEENPAPETFEAWLLHYPLNCASPELTGPARAMARAVFDDWRLAIASADFRRWPEQGAPSDDAS